MSAIRNSRRRGEETRRCASARPNCRRKICGRDGHAIEEGDEDCRNLQIVPVKTKQHTTLGRVLGHPSARERRGSATTRLTFSCQWH